MIIAKYIAKKKWLLQKVARRLQRVLWFVVWLRAKIKHIAANLIKQFIVNYFSFRGSTAMRMFVHQVKYLQVTKT